MQEPRRCVEFPLHFPSVSKSLIFFKHYYRRHSIGHTTPRPRPLRAVSPPPAPRRFPAWPAGAGIIHGAPDAVKGGRGGVCEPRQWLSTMAFFPQGPSDGLHVRHSTTSAVYVYYLPLPSEESRAGGAGGGAGGLDVENEVIAGRSARVHDSCPAEKRDGWSEQSKQRRRQCTMYERATWSPTRPEICASDHPDFSFFLSRLCFCKGNLPRTRGDGDGTRMGLPCDIP